MERWISPQTDFREGAVRPGGAATAGNATINNNGTTNFFDMSTAGNATIITNFAVTNFFDTSTAGDGEYHWHPLAM